ncbi:MAG: GGDEF domain-containing protein [Eubacterium sp.]|nr:GGDEF domain-containing protein [Eubacterium sp.]
MGYNDFVKKLKNLACIVSIEKNSDGTFGEPCIEAANNLYLQSVNVSPSDFVPSRPYHEYIYRDSNFEAMSLKCIRDGRAIHSYVDAEFYNSWMDIYMMPLNSEEADKGYLLFSYEMTPKAETDKLTDVSPETAMQVIRTSIRLRENTDFMKAMELIVEDIRQICKANRCCILQTDFKARKCSILGHSMVSSERAKRLEHYITDDFFEIVEGWEDLIAGSNCFIIHDEKDMLLVKEKNPEWYDSLKSYGVNNLVLYPLRTNGEIVGYIWATNFDISNTLSIKQTLEVTTFILAAEISNHQMFKRMEVLSATDLLTGLYNRNAMNNRITDIVTGKDSFTDAYGVIFIDLNGLKVVNDKEGHNAGDQLLKDAAVMLRETFKDCEIYRVGGDEFLVIVLGQSEEQFNKLVDQLRTSSENSDHVKVAIGTCFGDSKLDIRKAMHFADERMYIDKEEYYNKHPECKRRMQ